MLGNALFEKECYDEALQAYDKALELCPSYWSVWASKGNCLLSLERFEEALPCFETALADVPDEYAWWNSRGVVLHRLGRDDEALECYRKALDLCPDYVLALSNMADVYMKHRAIDKAEELYMKAYSIGNRPSDLLSATKCMYISHRFEEMVQSLLTLLPVAKQEGLDVAYRLGVAYKNLQQYEEAIRYFKLQLETSQDGFYSSACWFNIALCEKELKHLNQAEATLKKALELFDSDEEKAMCHFVLGELYLEREQYRHALEHLDQAVALDPEIEDYAAARKVVIRRIKQSNK